MKLTSLVKTAAVILPVTTAPVTAGVFNAPTGLAVDQNSGNLYVANEGSSKIIVFNDNLIQQPALTITAGINQPYTLAIDQDSIPLVTTTGTLYVGNLSGNPRQITTYVLGTTTQAPLSFPVTEPVAMAVGADHVLYEQDVSGPTLNVYNLVEGTSLIRSLPTGVMFSAIGSDNGLFYYGDGVNINVVSEPKVWSDQSSGGSKLAGPIGTTFSINFDNFHNAYFTTQSGEIYALTARLALGIMPLLNIANSTGIAVDKTRNRLFVSVPSKNLVNVYSIVYGTNNVPQSLTLLKTLQ
ncbi:MAG TPA: hypothetical protein VEK34_08205 [Methylocella sp.]|nr:hypothetical protein [Methylocella sp.]